MTREGLRAALDNANVQAFLRVIREGESGQGDDAYRLENGGRLLPAYQIEHPSKGMRSPPGKAFGAYQFLASTWAGLVKKYGFTSMTPNQQDEAAIALIVERGALDEIERGEFDRACFLLGDCWTSLPGGAEQNAATRRARETYIRHGGAFAPQTAPESPRPVEPLVDAPAFDPDSLAGENYEGREPYEYTPPQQPQQEASMALPLIPLITAFGPQLLQLIPQLGSLFGSGSDVQVRNVKAATMAVDAIVKATDSPNLQAAVEKMQEDPDVARTARAAVAEVMTLIEVGGGIVEARKAAYSPDQTPPWKNPAVWVAGAVLPLVYMVAAAVLFGIGGQTWSDDIKTLLVTAIVTGALGSITGFFLGSSLGSQRKTEMKG